MGSFIEDLIQIITVFSCKLQGKRANRLINENGGNNDKNNSSDVTSKQQTKN